MWRRSRPSVSGSQIGSTGDSIFLSAASARTGNHEVDLLGFEAVPGAEMAADPVDQVSFVMVDFAADFAYEVEMVVRMPQFPPCTFIRTQARLPHQVQISEQCEGAVHRGGIDGRIGLVHLPHDFLDGQVAPSAIQDFPDPEPGLGEAVAPIPEQFSQFLFDGHHRDSTCCE